MRNVADKITNHIEKVLGVLNDIESVVSVGLLERNKSTGIETYAKPVGVVSALTPVTKLTAATGSMVFIIVFIISMVKIIFSSNTGKATLIIPIII